MLKTDRVRPIFSLLGRAGPGPGPGRAGPGPG